MLEGHALLQSALWQLYQLIKGWVAPKVAVGPSARMRGEIDAAATDDVQQQIDSMDPLHAGWEPDEPSQQALYRKLLKS